jgi:hypothetical protein
VRVLAPLVDAASTVDRARVSTYVATITDRRLPPVRAVLHNHDLVRALIACAASATAEWSLWTGALVYAHAHGGATAAGLVSLVLVVPAALVAPFGGSTADTARPGRSLVVVFAVQSICLTSAALAALAHAPLPAVVAPIAVTTTLLTFVRPAYSVVVPGLVATTAQLTAANLLTGYVDNAAVLVGPLLAGALLELQGPALVFAACAAMTFSSTVATAPLARLDPPPVVPAPDRPRRSRGRRLVDDTRRLARSGGVAALLVVLSGQYVLIGGLDLIYVILATDTLHLDASGPGLLSACFGAGSLVGGLLSTLLFARRRLAPHLIASLGVIAVALVILAGGTALTSALVLLPVIGASRAVFDVTGRMLIQRAAPQDALGTVFATLEALSLAETVLGSVVVQVLIAVAGVRAALAGMACLLGLLVVAAVVWLRSVDDVADAHVVEVRLLRRMPVFAPLPLPELEGIARTSRHEVIAAGRSIITTGETGDRYYAIAGGTVDVFVDGAFVRTLSRGAGFGEIALLADVPRTATVVAVTETDVLCVERSAFLTAVTGHDASRQAAWALARSYADRAQAGADV